MHLFCIPSDDRQDETCAENCQGDPSHSQLLALGTRAQSPQRVATCTDIVRSVSPIVGGPRITMDHQLSDILSPTLRDSYRAHQLGSPARRTAIEAGQTMEFVLPSQDEKMSVPLLHMLDPSRLSKPHLRRLVGDVGLALFAPLDIDGLETTNDFLSSVEFRDDDCHRNLQGYRAPQHHGSHGRLGSAKYNTDAGSSKLPKRLLISSEGSFTVSTGAETIVTDDHGDEEPQTDDDNDEEDECYGCWIVPEPPHSCPRLLTPDMLQLLASHFPLACQGHMLERCFCIGSDGDSMLSMLYQCRMFRYTILVIQTTRREVLGGFATANWNDKRHNVYYGNGQSFLFASHPDESTEPYLVDGQASASDGCPLVVYPWSGDNDYCQICDPDQNRIAMGGEGDFGLIVRDNFGFGETGRSRTYRNPPLVAGGRFEISAFEVYGIVPFSLSPPRMPFATA